MLARYTVKYICKKNKRVVDSTFSTTKIKSNVTAAAAAAAAAAVQLQLRTGQNRTILVYPDRNPGATFTVADSSSILPSLQGTLKLQINRSSTGMS